MSEFEDAEIFRKRPTQKTKARTLERDPLIFACKGGFATKI
jgi:hypothetical protein